MDKKRGSQFKTAQTGQFSRHIQLIALNEQKADSTQTLLSNLIDGGNTEELNTDVIMSLPEEALDVNQQLLDESPYLSDTVMESAIYKEDVLPNAMIRDILVANPQSAKSDKVLNALNDRWDPMPDYMMDEIMTGKDSLGNKELLEGQIKGYKHLRDLAYNTLVGNYLRDTVNVDVNDSLVAVLGNEQKLHAKYSLAFNHLKHGDTALMREELENIPITFELTNEDQQIYQDYLSYISIMQQLQYDTINRHYPDSSQIVNLFSLVDNGHGLPSVYAQNMLKHLGFLSCYEPVYFPVSLNSNEAGKWPFDQPNYPKSSSLKLFPNPAADYFIVEYEISQSYEQAVITIYDMKGKTINNYQLSGNQNQIVLPTGTLNNGIYMVTLFIDNKPIDTQKITIFR